MALGTVESARLPGVDGRNNVVRARAVKVDRPYRCATCGTDIPKGSAARRDEWVEPVFGALLASVICAECQSEGL